MKSSKKLVMTLLVRDEEDILEYNICHHLNQGVDFIVSADNGSKDGTVSILEKYRKMHVLSYNLIKEHTYEQNKWVSRLAKKAVNQYKATHLLHADADEFWIAADGDLKNQIDQIQDVLLVPIINYLPPKNGDKEFDFKYIQNQVIKPLPYPGTLTDMKSSDVLLYEYPPKVITINKFIDVNYGNHSVNSPQPFITNKATSIVIHHFSIRSYRHFERKVINGGSAYANNPLKIADLGWHWKAWYVKYQQGKLPEEYRNIASPDRIYGQKINSHISYMPVLKRIRYSPWIFRMNYYNPFSKY